MLGSKIHDTVTESTVAMKIHFLVTKTPFMRSTRVHDLRTSYHSEMSGEVLGRRKAPTASALKEKLRVQLAGQKLSDHNICHGAI